MQRAEERGAEGEREKGVQRAKGGVQREKWEEVRGEEGERDGGGEGIGGIGGRNGGRR